MSRFDLPVVVHRRLKETALGLEFRRGRFNHPGVGHAAQSRRTHENAFAIGVFHAQQQHFLATRQPHRPVRSADFTLVLHAAGNQEDIAGRRADAAHVDHGSLAIALEDHVATGHELVIVHIQSRGDEACGIDHRFTADNNPVGVDHQHLPVGLQIPHQLGNGSAGDAVQSRGITSRLQELSQFAHINGEVFPLNHRGIRALKNLQGAFQVLDNFSRAFDHLPSGRIRIGHRG